VADIVQSVIWWVGY